MKTRIVFRIISFFWVVLLCSCTILEAKPTVFPSVTGAVPIALSPSPTLYPISSNTPRITAFPASPSSTEFTTPKEPVDQPTDTGIPPFAASEAEDKVMELLNDNGDCRLPCFWGFIPGKTSEETLSSFFHSFTKIGGHDINMPRSGSTVEVFVNWPYHSSQSTVRRIDVAMKAYRKIDAVDRNVFNNPDLPQIIHYYTLPSLLSRYGPPAKAYLGIELGSEVGGDDLLILSLDYSEFGWYVQFRMPMSKTENSFTGCPAQAFTYLSLFPPEDKFTPFQDLERLTKEVFTHPLEDVTMLTVDEFYLQFKNFANDQCLITPMENWKELTPR